MYCNNCGNQNKEGVRFCVKCGAPIGNARPSAPNKARRPQAAQTINAVGGAVKKWTGNVIRKYPAAILAIALLALIATFNIWNVKHNILSVGNRDEARFANADNYEYETDKYLYFNNNSGFARFDKTDHTLTPVSNKEMKVVAVENDRVICYDDDLHVYKISDSKDEAEDLGIKLDSDQDRYRNFFDGKYIYVVTDSCAIRKYLFTKLEEHINWCTEIYKPESDYEYKKARLYKGYMYILMTEEDTGNNSLVKVSLSSGKSKVISDKGMINFIFYNNNIIYSCVGGGYECMNLDGGGVKEYKNNSPESARSVFNMVGADKYVYFFSKGECYRFEADGGEINKIQTNLFQFGAVDGGLVYRENKKLIFLDYDCNRTAEYDI